MIVTDADFLRHIRYLPQAGRTQVEHALRAARHFHEGQMRDSGVPYITHPVAVADYLAYLEADADTLTAALLHDVIEDDRATSEEIAHEFGEDVAQLVDAVTKLTKVNYEGRRGERQVASLRKMLLIASDDLRVILIKLADRWHNVETINSLPPDKRVRVANETLDIYVPFARLAGLYDLKERFETVCFPIALPEEYALWHREIEAMRSRLHKEREDFIGRIDAETDQHVMPRITKMTAYEVFMKLQGNISRLQDSQSIDSVLLIVDRNDELACYDVLGQVHMRYPVRAFSFKDFVSAPQPNGYRALHTTIFLSLNHQLVLRIQTREMFDYATSRKMSSWMSSSDTQFRSTLASLSRAPSGNAQFMTDLKSNILAGRINVFTTSGEVLNLPKDATGIDFAFALNPGHIAHLAGVRINGDAREATAVLKEGDTVDLMLLDVANPALRVQWVDKAKSIEAREAVREELSLSPRAQQESEGRKLLELECRKHALPPWWLLHLSSLQTRVALTLDELSFPDVLAGIGTGQIPLSKVIDAYRALLVLSPTVLQKLLKFLNLLPKTRVLNRESKIISFEVTAKDRKGLIYDITKCIAERNLNIPTFGVYAVPPGDSLYKITVEVQRFEDFSDLFDALLQVPSVKTVLRK